MSPPRFAPAARRLVAGALVCLAAGGCGRGDRGAADSALARDLTLAAGPAPSPGGSVTLADTAVAARVAAPTPTPPPPHRSAAPRVATRPTPRPAPEAPDASAPAPAPMPAADAAPAPAPAATSTAGHTFGAGTGLVLATSQPVCSSSNHTGDRFVASLREPVTAADGGTLPAGTDVVLELTSLILGPAERGRVEFAARGISIGGFIRPVSAEVAWVDTTLERRAMASTGGSDAGRVGHGAMTGAILGRVFGGGAKGTVIGAAAGAAAGAAGARANMHFEGCLPKGATVRMRLTGPLSI